MMNDSGRHPLMHLRCNDLLKNCGDSALRPFERFHRFFIRILRKVSPPGRELGMPAAFEHLTSAISRDFIVNRHFWAANLSNAAIDFMNWHALEELEHQAVC